MRMLLKFMDRAESFHLWSLLHARIQHSIQADDWILNLLAQTMKALFDAIRLRFMQFVKVFDKLHKPLLGGNDEYSRKGIKVVGW